MLLYTGGTDFQELYYTLIPEGEEKSLGESFEVLDDYFVPKVNVPFERHLFRQMSQVAGETVDQFVCRLRQKAITCDFPNVEEAIRDRLIEKCGNAKLRRKFLEKANTNLQDLQDVARAFEAVEIQMKSLEQSGSQYKPENGQVNSVRQFYKKGGKGNRYGDRASGQHGKETGTDQIYFNCNRTGHFVKDSTCPARDRKCKECGISGHFAACCRKRDNKTQKKDIRKGMKAERRELIK